MKKITILGALLLSMASFAQKLDDYQRIEVKGEFTNPLFSPTGEYLLLTGEHMQGVYLLHLETLEVKEISKSPGSGYGYTWDASGNSFYYKEKPEKGYFTESKVFSYNVRDNYKTAVVNIDHNYLPSYTGSKTGTVVYTNLATLKIDGKDLSSLKNWTITSEPGQYYNALLSHNGKMVAVHNGPDIYVYNVDGSTPGKKVGSGLATVWSENDDYLIGFMDESEDGHTVSNSDLYLFNVKGEKPKKLTNTEVFFEMYPTVYKNKVVFSDDKTGRLFIANLK
jgi:tricorn protease-like protein